MSKRVLIAATSHDRKGDTGTPTGAYLSEIAHPWDVFTRAGYEVEFASVRGGRVPLDGVDTKDPVVQSFTNGAMGRLHASIRSSDIDPSRYDAILFAGGHGTMWDFPLDPGFARVAVQIWEAGGVVAAVCHGSAALVNVRLPSGDYLVQGKDVSAFTNEEERAVGLDHVVPFSLEDTLSQRGAHLVVAPKWQKQVVVSARLVTGQNPASATGVAEAVVRVLSKGEVEVGLEPTERATDVLSIDTMALLDAPENAALRGLLDEAKSPSLRGKRVAILVTDGAEEIELTFVRKVLTDFGATVEIVSPAKPSFPTRFGVKVPSGRGTHVTTVKWMENSGAVRIDRELGSVGPESYDAVYVPGGAWNPDMLRADENALAFVRRAAELEKIVGSICHGPQVLLSAGLAKGRKMTAWGSMRIDLTNAGATFVDEPVVIDGNIITSRAPIDLAAFTRALVEALAR
jgi:PfpI family intracellular protease